ncbi:MAG: 2-C-methyl-D-erythritol 4-phosphate cytidylyltransferase [Culturomica sp.]|jgi:2-C-methyl-D-erythritol 4-phosphate cytidylyltransferase|nr:2-C-methyl-D-erythritol 4-phosphate cytidylyltransferase [Culturomica sp.]
MKNNIAIILANGRGQRFGGEQPKQFLKIGDRSVLEHSITAFQDHPEISEIIIVADKDFHDTIWESVKRLSFNKVSVVIEGGKERHHSSIAAINHIGLRDCNILIHDAVRPFVNREIIDNVIGALAIYKAVNVGVPATDTVVAVDNANSCIMEIPDRKQLYMVQTPQGFDSATLREAFSLANNDPNFQPTDDCSVVKKYLPNEKIKVVAGSRRNIKLTWKEDFNLAEFFINDK